MPPDHNSQATAEPPAAPHPEKGKIAEVQGGVAALPAHVAALKNTVLDFKHFVGLEATILVLCDEFVFDEDDGNAIPLSAYKTDGSKESQRAWERELLEDARQLAEGTRKLESSFAQDVEWQNLFRRVVMSRMDAVPPLLSHMPKSIEYVDSDGWDSASHRSQSSLRDHRPDLCFGFPIYKKGEQKIEGLRNDPYLKNFTFDLLSKLAKKGLRCTPVSGSHTKMPETGENRAGLQNPAVCFPWCIMQHVAANKESEDLEMETFRRVSLVASPALSMFEQLARFADVKQDGEHIQPVIAITSVGSSTTLALAYSEIIDARYTDHKILSVWEGCISKIWDAIQFCRIVDNMFYWSENVLRHKVSHYIDQWKLHYCPKEPNIHSRVEEDPETAELVHRIQDRLSFLDISPSSNMIELVKQAVILQEVVKLDVRKTESVKYSPSPNAEEGATTSSMFFSSHRSVDKSIMRESREGLEKEWKQKDPESGAGGSQKGEDELGSSHRDKIRSASGGTHNKSNLEPISPQKYAKLATKSPVSDEKHKKADSTAPIIDFSFPAVGKNFWLANCSETISSAPPNPFTATHFEPRIDVKPWFYMMNREIPSRPKVFSLIGLRYKDSEPDPERARKSPSGALRADTARHFPRPDAIKRKAQDDQGYSSSSVEFSFYRPSSSRSDPVQREKFLEPILPKKKIPWKDKFILVRLSPPPTPRKDPDLLPEDRRSEI